MDCLPHIHVAALHAEQGYRSFVPGLGAFCRDGDTLLGAGVFKNSIGNTSAYFVGGLQPLRFGSVKAGAVLGAATGYYHAVVPLGAAVLSYKHIHLSVIPKVEGKAPATLAFSFTWDIR